jgi:Domain of unknown function (DUF4460)
MLVKSTRVKVWRRISNQISSCLRQRIIVHPTQLSYSSSIVLQFHRFMSSSSSTDSIPINEFKALLPFVKRFILQVHPDVMSQYGRDIVETNEASLQEFFKLFDSLKERSSSVMTSGNKKPNAPITASKVLHSAPLKSQYSFIFYVLDAQSKLSRVPVDVKIPLMFEERMRIMTERGLSSAAKAHWMDVSIKSLKTLISAIGGFPPTNPQFDETKLGSRKLVVPNLTLSDEDSAILKQAEHQEDRIRNAKMRMRGELPGADAAMRNNLLHMSPIEQGKFTYKDSPSSAASGVDEFLGMETDAFTEKQRGENARRAISKCQFGEDNSGGGASKNFTFQVFSISEKQVTTTRFLRVLMRYHDSLRLYHPAWTILRIVFTKQSQCAIDLQKFCLYVPIDTTQYSFVHFVRLQWSSLVGALKVHEKKRTQPDRV